MLKRLIIDAELIWEIKSKINDQDLINRLESEMEKNFDTPKDGLVYRLLKRAEIRRSIQTRKSVQENKPDRLSELLDEAAMEIYNLRKELEND